MSAQGTPGTNIALEEFVASARSFLEAHYSPTSRGGDTFNWGEGSDEVRVFQEPDRLDEQRRVAEIREWRATLWKAGYGWISGPEEYGGAGLPVAYQRAFEALAREFDVPGDAMLTVGLGMVAPTILKHGTESQKHTYLPALYSGELIGCQLFSEPGAGSDLAAVSTRAVREGDDWVVSGQKVWTSGAHLADLGLVVCRTSDGPRHANLTTFLVDMHAPGVEVRPLRQMTGGAAFNEVFLTDVRIADGDRLDEVGRGWPVVVSTLGFERGAIGHSAFGGSGILSTERLIALTRSQAKQDDPVVRRAFGELVVNLRAARYTQAVMGARRANGPELSVGKLKLSENMFRVGDYVSSVLGTKVIADAGEWGTYAWSAVLLGAPGYRIGGGTDEILKNVIAQRVLGLPRPR